MKLCFNVTKAILKTQTLWKNACLFLVVVMAFSIFSLGAFSDDNVVWLPENYAWTNDVTFQDGLMLVYEADGNQAYIDEDTQYGFIDINGKVVIPVEYNNCSGFFEGLAAVSKDGKYGFIDETGVVVIPFTYAYCSNFRDGLAKVRIDDGYSGKYGFIDKTGKKVIPAIYNYASDFIDGIAAVTNENDEIGFIDKNGKLLVQTEYKDYIGDDIQQFNEGLCPVCVESQYGFINTTGKLVIDTIYFDYGMISNPYRFVNGVSMVILPDEEGNVKFIDKTGKRVPEPKVTVNGLAVEYEDGKYGAFDASGKQVLPFDYDYLGSFTEGLAVASKENKYGMIDRTGKEIIPFVYDQVSNVYKEIVFVRKDGKVGVIKNVLAGEPTPDTVTAMPTSSKVIVNGKDVTFEAYGINGNNYFKLRDLAIAVNGSNKQFEVTWDGEKNAINLISNKSYTEVGGELAVSENPTHKNAARSTSTIFVDGISADLTAYIIGGNNYFKLRDVLQAFDIGVTWDGTKNTIRIDTNSGYTD